MRVVLMLGLLITVPAQADISVGGSVGAGAQGAATYSAVELRLDGQWEHARLGLGVRGVWDDGAFRQREWASAWDAVAIVRDAGASTQLGATTLAIAAGALAPAYVGTLVDGYRVSLDDRWRTGARASAQSETLEAGAEIDDVLDPALIAGRARWLMAAPWGMHAGVAVDPGTRVDPGVTHMPVQPLVAAEAGGFRRFHSETARADVGVAIVAEVSRGASVVAFSNATIERGTVRFTGRIDARAGTGSVGGAFGALHRVERFDAASAGAGAGGGASVGVAAPQGWLELGARTRPERGALAIASIGAPMGRWVQAGAWAGIGREARAGAAELRVAWANRLFSALHAARLYRFDAMEPLPIWSVTVWFGVASQ